MREKATYLPVPALLGCIFISLMIIGCDLMPSDNEPFDKIDPMVQPPPPIEMTLEVEKHDVPLFQPVSMRLSITNTSDTAIELGVPGVRDDLIYYNFIVIQPDSVQIWNRMFDDYHDEGIPVLASQLNLNLKAGETITFDHVWDQKDLNDRQVRSGNYVVFGILGMQYTDPATSEETEGEFATEPVPIVID